MLVASWVAAIARGAGVGVILAATLQIVRMLEALHHALERIATALERRPPDD